MLHANACTTQLYLYECNFVATFKRIGYNFAMLSNCFNAICKQKIKEHAVMKSNNLLPTEFRTLFADMLLRQHLLVNVWIKVKLLFWVFMARFVNMHMFTVHSIQILI